MAALPTLSQSAMTGSKLSFGQTAANRWQAFDAREKTLVTVAGAVLACALLWWLGIAPALNVLKTAKTQSLSLNAQLQQMQVLEAQAKALQALPKIKSGDSAQALVALGRQRLGTAAQLSVNGTQATLTMTGASPDALAQFLSQARATANATPSQARLRRNASNPQAWDGTLVMSLPAQ